MDLTLLLAKVFGVYFIVIGASVFLKSGSWRKVIDEFSKNTALMHITGMFVLILGLLVVLSHNHWGYNFRGLVTLLGWLTLIKGAGYLLLPSGIMAGWVKIMNSRSMLMFWGIVVILIGLYLAGKGFVYF
jgi:hypothetical protein